MTSRTLRRIMTAAAGVAVAAAGLAAPTLAAPTAAAGGAVEYVNLGDSFSAGSGVSPIAAGTPESCWQSVNNYAHIVAREHGYRLTDVSCGGAATEDFFTSQQKGSPPQLDALDDRVDLVTLAIGGNDGDVFGSAIKDCVIAGVSTAWQGSPCSDRHKRTLMTEVRTGTYPSLVKAFTAVRTAAPNADVYALNYPWIAPRTNGFCPALPLAGGDYAFTHRLQSALHDAIARAAAKTGVTLVDVASASEGHDSCKPEGVRWVEPLITTVQPVPVHPNALGERRMADVTSAAIDR
ncbi:SGNH/GDSL hydrolase family protein [Gordonia shandongensis]|uniref:SGNH/GDSL hydrolase family protein n=1 Tax=Gordonia shandongensis TaxID=376351 RepID=UPI000684D90E|nr:SGNH/GDSL hydrolase family protein [Gordonia shandongensis]